MRAFSGSRQPALMRPRASRSRSDPGKLYVAWWTGACACPGGQHHRDALGQLAENGRDGGRDVPATERRDDQAVGLLPQRLDEAAVVAQNDRRNGDPHPPGRIGLERR